MGLVSFLLFLSLGIIFPLVPWSLLSCLARTTLTHRYYYEKKFEECRGVIQPEMALPMGIPGAFCLPVRPLLLLVIRHSWYRTDEQISLFWLAWSANRTHWMAPVMSHFLFGAGTTWMFMVRLCPPG